MKVRVFENPDGSVRIMQLNPKMRRPGESDVAFGERMFPIEAAKAGLESLPFSDIEEADIPATRQDRRKWRVKQRGGRRAVEVDPDLP